MKTDHVNQNSAAPASDESVPAPCTDAPSLLPSVPSADSISTKTPANTLTALERARIESLKRKQRSNSFMQKLSHEQIAKIIEWFQDEEDVGIVHHNITAPAPEGLGLDVSITSVRRLRAHVTATLANTRTTEILDTIIDMEADADLAQSTQAERIQSAINQLLHQKAFELARTAPGAPELFEILAAIERLSALDLKRQKIALDREKMLRRDQRASQPPFTQEHKVELKILPATPAIEPAVPSHYSHVSHSSHNSHQSAQPQPIEIIAPLPEVIL